MQAIQMASLAEAGNNSRIRDIYVHAELQNVVESFQMPV
jgi:hypothetical protein